MGISKQDKRTATKRLDISPRTLKVRGSAPGAGHVSSSEILQRMIENNAVQVNSITGGLIVNGQPMLSQPPAWYDVLKRFGGTVNTGIDASGAIQDAIDAVPRGAAHANGLISEGGVVYLQAGSWKINTKLDASSGETGNHYRQNLTIQGDGNGATIIYSDTLTELFYANTSVDYLTLRDLTFITTAQFAGLGTVERVLQFDAATYVDLNKVKVWAKKPGANNTDCILIDLMDSYSAMFTNCRTFTNNIASSEVHNVSFAANAPKYGGTHIRSNNTNHFNVRNHRWENGYRNMHLINDDGAFISGGDSEQYIQGFLLDNCENCVIQGIRFETHPENLFQYEGYDTHYHVMFTETSKYNKVISSSIIKAKTNIGDYGFVDLNGSNLFEINNVSRVRERRALIRNGDFALGPYTNSTVQIPGWNLSGTPTVTEELTDLPEEAGITRAIKLVTTGNVHGIKAPMICTFDPERFPRLAWKLWMKRLIGDHSLRLLLRQTGTSNYLTSNMLTQGHGIQLTDAKTGIPITGTPVWAAGSLTINSAVPKNFVKVNEKITLSGFTVSGVALNGSYLVSSVTDNDTFVLAVAGDPGTISVVGTFAHTGIDAVARLDEWVEYKGVIPLRQSVIDVTVSGANVVLTLSNTSYVPNTTAASVKLTGFSNPAYNGVFPVVSTSGAAGVIVTILNPGGAAPVETGAGDSTLSLVKHYGWCGFYGEVSLEIASEFAAPNVTATHLISGVVLKQFQGEQMISDSYLPGISLLAAKKTFDWPDCVAGGEQSTTVTVAGAAVGDSVTVGLSPDNASLARNGVVTSTDTVTITIRNPTGSDINLPSCVITATVAHVY